jgi:hypothetical protein
MFDWIAEIFVSNSEKARLISILISAVIAILILLLSQFLVSQRERKNC